MRCWLTLFCLGVLAPMLQSVAGTFVAQRFVPEVGLLLAIALGLCWRTGAGGVVLVCLLGFATDLLSGSLLGQHALLRMLAFGAARLASQALNLRGGPPQAVFAAAVTPVNAAAIAALTAFFTPGSDGVWVIWRDVGPQALVNALAAPLVVWATASLMRHLSDDDGRRLLRLAPRGRAA